MAAHQDQPLACQRHGYFGAVIQSAGAGSRYLRAIKRLRDILARIPGFDDL